MTVFRIRPFIVICAAVCILFASNCYAACGRVNGVICNGGTCVSGSCLCPTYLVGPDCEFLCPGPESSPCNYKGLCIPPSNDKAHFANCTCADQFRGLDCAISCPIFSGSICSGRGLCNNNGTCQCNMGFRGSDCSVECSGGSHLPCSGHGTCLSDGSCACNEGYYGVSCNANCATKHGVLCSGRGAFKSHSSQNRCLRRVTGKNRFAAGTCSEVTGRCQCTQVQDSSLISGFYGDACEFVKYNRSGIYSFSTSVQSASKLAIYMPHAIAAKCLAQLTHYVQVSSGNAVDVDCCSRACNSASDHRVLDLLGDVLQNECVRCEHVYACMYVCV